MFLDLPTTKPFELPLSFEGFDVETFSTGGVLAPPAGFKILSLLGKYLTLKSKRLILETANG